MEKKLLTKEEILKVSDITSEGVAVPEWGGDVMVFGLTGRECDEYEQSLIDMAGKKNRVNLSDARAKLAVASIRDEKGKWLFTIGNLEQLSKKSAKALDRIVKTAQRLSGLTDDDLEEMVKNSKKTQVEDSSSV